ncbi:MAG TPA: dolichol kinase [Candidatus Kapabacteria bacterium]|nr:dolichol kinase [Candidatus Kapabacteria bacterium]
MNYNSENNNITDAKVISNSEKTKNLENISYEQELLRKSIHLASLSIPIAYIFVTKEFALWLLIPITFLTILIDILGKYDNFVKKYLYFYFEKMLRQHEKNGELFILNGASWVLIAALITIIIFPKVIAVISFMILIISDISAALIGRRFGKHKILDKSYEGTSAFIISGIFVVWIMGAIFNADMWFYIAGYIGAFMGGIAELVSTRIRLDDNLAIPLAVGTTMSLINMLAWNIFHTSFLNLFMM